MKPGKHSFREIATSLCCASVPPNDVSCFSATIGNNHVDKNENFQNRPQTSTFVHISPHAWRKNMKKHNKSQPNTTTQVDTYRHHADRNVDTVHIETTTTEHSELMKTIEKTL